MHYEIKLDFKKLRCVACCYIALPLLVFLIGFLRWYYALIGTIALVFVMRSVLCADNVEPKHRNTTTIRVSGIACVFLFTLIWTYLGGQNGYFYQSSDWDCRNAVFHDLIQQKWPVIYESTGAALVYYIGHWLPPAVFGKIILWLTGSFRWAWFLGKMALWCWTSLGLTIVILLIFHFLKITEKKKRILAVLIFVFFSGMDFLGALRFGKLGQLLAPDTLHLEWWTNYQFSSITTCLFWVFNQVVVPWIITICFLMEDSPRNYVFYCVACLLCGPFPCVGIVICMVVKAVCYCVEHARLGQWREAGKNIFSFGNVIALAFLFPFVAAYILANNAVAATSNSEIALVQSAFFSREYWTPELIWFLILEAGCYLFLIFRDHKKDPIYYTLILTFVICPYFHIGASQDFCMRVSVPAVFILMLYENDFLLRHFRFKLSKADFQTQASKQICAWVLAACFFFGAVTPVIEIYRGFYHVITEGTIKLEDKRIITFDNGKVFLNFNATNPNDQIFFRYFSK